MLLPEVNDCMPKRNNRFFRGFGRFLLTTMGWKVKGELPAQKKFILALAPHTSNWDFVVGVAVMLALDIKINFLGKHSIFIWPFKGFLIRIGGIPIDRSKSHGVVEQLVQRCQHSEYFVLGIAPEGTRSKTKEWKSGFLQIAHQANIPVVPVSLHFDKKEVYLQPAQLISADIDNELIRIKRCFIGACAKNPQAV